MDYHIKIESRIFMHFHMAAMLTAKGTVKCNVTNHGIAPKRWPMPNIKGGLKALFNIPLSRRVDTLPLGTAWDTHLYGFETRGNIFHKEEHIYFYFSYQPY